MDELTEYEKAIESTNRLAQVISAYYLALLEAGISRDDVLAIVVQYQKEILTAARPGNK